MEPSYQWLRVCASVPIAQSLAGILIFKKIYFLETH